MRSEVRILMVIAALSAFVAIHAQTGSSAAEQEFLMSVNRARQSQGLSALRWNEALATAARKHAAIMAQHGSAEHGFPGEPSLSSRVMQSGVHFVWLSENVILGSDVAAIEAEFLRSPKHRANILDPDMDTIGVGVVERGGQLFVVEDFAKVK
jgi:uncharacterized protein YkwD